ncbi:WAT1-related protein At1g70260-like [Nicotiana sylvestris]|uniref:WAT1-related protein n=1 Tax=Nicotiana sylvestris TaxID=4096 RepID=A0A1U7XI47_NICSY|nr:PREDICTED: WAT1-related protein At1g70260-like [Nicotiana sylvestris]
MGDTLNKLAKRARSLDNTEIESGGENMGVKAVVEDILPCTAMVLIEICTIFLTIMASTTMSRLGMSPFVFVVYTNALSSIILLPYSFLYHRRDKIQAPLFTFPLLLRVSLLGLVGVTIAQNLAFAGLSYSSPIVACGMANQIPAFTFILAIFLRKIKVDLKSQGSQARIIGSLISIMGALSITYYKGPVVKQYSPFFLQLARPRLLAVFTSTHENWVLGCFLFAAASFSLCIWNIIQAGTIRKHPQVMKIVFLYTLFGTIQSAILALLMEKDLRVWRLELNMELLVVVLTAIFGSLIRSSVQMWCMRLKGASFPLFFKPVGVPTASTCGCLLFAETFHYGSMFSAIICGLGYYTTLWGQLKDDETNKNIKGSTSTTSDEKVPLLQEKEVEEEEEEEDSPV